MKPKYEPIGMPVHEWVAEKPKSKLWYKIKLGAFLTSIATILFIIIAITVQLVQWHNHWQLQLQNFILITPRTQALHPLIKHAEAKAPDTTEGYICYVFGKDCPMALAISQAENGTRQCDRFGINTNNTIDVGIFQINSVHITKDWTLKDLTDCHKNIDYAKQIFDQSGWIAWSTYNNGSYKQFLQ